MSKGPQKLGGLVRPYFGGRSGAPPRKPTSRLSAELPTPATFQEAAPPSLQPSPTSPVEESPPPAPTPPPGAMQAAVREAASAAGWGVLEMGDDLQIDVAMSGDRSQIVSVGFDHADREGEPITVFSSICGPLQEHNAAPLLRYNAKLPYGAFVAERMADREEMVVLRATLPSPCTDSAALARLIAEIASRADKVEGKLTGRDHF